MKSYTESTSLRMFLSLSLFSVIILSFDYGQSYCKSKYFLDWMSHRTKSSVYVADSSLCTCQIPPTTSTYNIEYVQRESPIAQDSVHHHQSGKIVDRQVCDATGAHPFSGDVKVPHPETNCYITGNAFGIHNLEDIPNCDLQHCFDFERDGCGVENGSIAVFDYTSLPSFSARFAAYSEYSKGWMMDAKLAAKESFSISFVEDPNNACVFWVWAPPISGNIEELEYWNNGINHVLFLPNYWRVGNYDLPGLEGSTHFSPGFSMLVLPTLIPEVYRPGYDLQIIRPPPGLGGWYLPSGALNESKFQRKARALAKRDRDIFSFSKARLILVHALGIFTDT
eukprot:m.12190 g.12190  ORF g.12190 m.12190 type:complete len:338 (+) comp9505_c0_seq1:502-1515(+)